VRYSLAILATLGGLIFSGCSGAPVLKSPPSSHPISGLALHGKVHGGQNPIAGASVYLYAANITGYGNASVSLLTSGANTTRDGNGNYYVTTDSAGNFSISGDYSCPGSTAQVYLYSIGGNPGSGANPAAGLLAGLGTCAVPITGSFILVDEVSTIATAYAIAGYATDATDVSSSGSALAVTGIANAFAAVANLETLGTGQALAATPAGNGAVPQSEINTLANILAACINSTGSGSSACTTLFANAMNETTAPGDTATAAINIAHDPGANIAALYNLSTTNPPFQPALTAAPNDFTISIAYTGGGMDGPAGLAIDGSGNVWVTNASGSSLSEFSPLGVAISATGFTGGGLDKPGLAAFDPSGNLWVANGEVGAAACSCISEFSSNGSPISGSSGYALGIGHSEGYQFALDASGDVWITNHGDTDPASSGSVFELNSMGATISGFPGYAGGGINDPNGIAIDTSGDIWVTNRTAGSLSELSSSGTPISGSSGYTGGGLSTAAAALTLIDGSGDVWAVNQNNSLSEFSSTGTPITGSTGYTGGGLDAPGWLAIDGASNVWVADQEGSLYDGLGNSISEFNSTGVAITGSNGYESSLPGPPIYIAVDASGNVWVTTPATVPDDTLTEANSIVEFIGVAAPTVTPVVANLLSPYGSHAVNKP